MIKINAYYFLNTVYSELVCNRTISEIYPCFVHSAFWWHDSTACRSSSIAQRNLGRGRIAIPVIGKWTRSLRALGAQRPLPTSTCTQPQVRYSHTVVELDNW